MFVDLSRVLVDFGLVVLIWMIQLIVYPSFLYYSKENLEVWHRKYTTLISYIVVPLMLFQLALAIYQIYTALTFFSVGSLVIILLIWGVTFIYFVPSHRSISKGEENKKLLLNLVDKNWLRTILWTLLFLWNIFYSMF